MSRRPVLLALLLACALGAASCGTGPAAGSPAPRPSGATIDPVGLTSYRARLSMTTKGTDNPGEFRCEGIVVLKPDPAVDVTVHQTGGGTPDVSMRVVRIGDTIWADTGGGLVATADPTAAAAADYILLKSLIGGAADYVGRMTSVNEEQRNGVATVHLVASPALIRENGADQQFGLADATWTWDVWVAKDGGLIVKYELLGTTPAGGTASLLVDLMEINSPANVVAAP